MLKKLIIIGSILLSSCNGDNTGADSYKFVNKEYSINNVDVHIVTYKSISDLRAVARKKGITSDGKIMAFTAIPVDDNTKCTIHIVDPAIDYKPEFLGHELSHCFWGQFHVSNQSHG